LSAGEKYVVAYFRPIIIDKQFLPMPVFIISSRVYLGKLGL